MRTMYVQSCPSPEKTEYATANPEREWWTTYYQSFQITHYSKTRQTT